MLDTLREGIKSIWAKIILGLIIASFVFAGVGSYLASGGSNAVAKVNGEEITRQQYQRRYQQDRNRIGEQFAQVFNTEAMLAKFQGMVMERLIMEKLARQANAELGIFVGRQVIKEQIRNTPQFQIAGKFDADTFRALIGRNGWTADQYENLLRQDMETRQLATIMDTEFALKSEVTAQLVLQGQTRSGRYINIDASLLQASIGFEGEAGEKELNQYYQSNVNLFQLPESLTVEYIELNEENLKPEVFEDEIATYYKEHLLDYASEEQRQASHILIIAATDADQATLDEAKSKIDAIAEKLKQGEDFASLAQQNSDDSVSAEAGGDVGFFGKNVMDPAFEQAAFALAAVDDISEVIRSDFGFHIIKLTAIKDSQQKALDEVKVTIEKILLDLRIDEMFIEINDIITEKAFEFTDSLQEVAAESGLEVKLSDAFPKAGGKGIFSNAAVIEAAYSDQVMVDGYNSDVISIGDNHSVVLRLKKHIESRTLAFEEVKAQIELNLRRQKAQLKALDFGERLLVALEQGESSQQVLEILPETLKAGWNEFSKVGRNDAVMTQQVRTKLFKMAHPLKGQGASLNGVVTQGFATYSGYTVMQLNQITEGDAENSTLEQKQQIEQQLSRQWSSAEDKAFQQWLLSHADIEQYLVPENTLN